MFGDLRIVRGHEVREHQGLDARRLGHASGIFSRRLVGDDALLQELGLLRREIRTSSAQPRAWLLRRCGITEVVRYGTLSDHPLFGSHPAVTTATALVLHPESIAALPVAGPHSAPTLEKPADAAGGHRSECARSRSSRAGPSETAPQASPALATAVGGRT